jgi:hypothetical protein
MDARSSQKSKPSVREADVATITSKPNPAVEAYLDEVWALSQPHPFARGVRLFGMTGVTLVPFDGGVHVNDIRQFGEPGKGEGTKVLRLLIDLADKHGVMIGATAQAYDKDKRFPMRTSAKLRDWYVRHGFVVRYGDHREGYVIRYMPKGDRK